MKEELVQSDITVIGGGLAGVCAAVAAARLGRTVSLVQNRPVLGGNSSSEVRVWVCGATAHGVNRYARETGIMGEMFLENQYRNADGNPYFWDLTVLEKVLAETNIRLFLNTDVHEVEAYGEGEERTIRSVTGWMMGSERRIHFESSMFLDCTGDGLVGFLAGAKYRLGREARHEYQEEWAPEEADDITLGSTILFYTKDAGHPVKYIPPVFAKDITQTSIPIKRVIRSGDSGCHYWWIEWGGELDTLHDNERIRDELWSVIYGIWDYIKNSGQFDADRMTLEWVGSVPGKREYRRFIGDYVLHQNDIIDQTPFEDRVAFGGWSIDLHPPQGMYSAESASKHLQPDGVYHIPFRSLYSVNVGNLLFAGRNISATHVAFGTTRVMATCAVIGEAAGTGAALCAAKRISPRELYRHHLKELQQTLLRQDASVLGIAGEDERDLARKAKVSASGTMPRITLDEPKDTYSLQGDVGLLVPADPTLERFELLLDASEQTQVTVELWETGKPENYIPAHRIMECSAAVAQGVKQWVVFEQLNWQPKRPQNAFLIIRANPLVQLYLSTRPMSGVLAFEKADRGPAKPTEDGKRQREELVALWKMGNLARQPFCFRLGGRTNAYSPDKIINGYSRPYGGPNQWMSSSLNEHEGEWIELAWDQEVRVKEIHVTFNDNVNEDLINLHHHRTPWEVAPELVKDYCLEVWKQGEWIAIAGGQGNRKRKRVHTLQEAESTPRLRIRMESTNGSPNAELVEIRVYE